MRPGSGRMLTYVRNQLTYLLYDASTETTKFRTFPDATQQPGLWAAFTALEELTYFLHATLRSRRESHADVSKENNSDSRKGKKEGGRKEGWQEARDNGLAPRCCLHLPICTCYFQTAASPAQFTGFGFKMW